MHTISARLFRFLQHTVAVTVGITLTACGGGAGAPTGTPEQALTGRTSFVSADGMSALQGNGSAKTVEAIMMAAGSPVALDAAPRAVQEGDIYRVLEPGKTILNLNPYRGLQIIDISNSGSPNIIGRAAVSGDPVEMYRSGDKVYILLNNWTEYRRVNKGGKESLEQFSGASIVTVDIANRAAPVIAATTRVPGNIQTSRMSTGGGKSALYVAAGEYAAIAVDAISIAPYTGQTKVLSYGINGQGLPESKSTLALGGYVQAVQATGDRLMVARADDSGGKNGSRVAVIDISSPDGTMVQGADVPIKGLVQKKTNMHIHANVLRVVSSNWWSSGSNVNHVETFNIADLARPKAIDHDTFGEGQQLFGTTFSANKAFFVTYLRQDPFHAFSITADGTMKEESEFIVSGWNDFFVPVHDEARLVGVGHNDENNRRSLAISLYDVTDLKNTRPLLMRAEIDLNNSWSEANWDDRGFTVLENASSAVAANGTRETGLILLPFTGYDAATQQYVGGVQIFTFSSTTVTRRGTMKHDMGIRRSFVGDAAKGIAVNLSASDLSLFGIQNTDAPQAKGSVQLAPNYGQFLAFKNVGVRYRSIDTTSPFQSTAGRRLDKVELVALANADGPASLASIDVPAGSQMYGVGGKLVVVSSEYGATAVSTTISTYDLSNAAKPVRLGSMTTDALVQNNAMVALSDKRICGIVGSCWGTYVMPETTVVGNTLVFSTQTGHAPQPASASILPRYWSSYSFQVLDLSKPEKPQLLPKISMQEGDEAVGLVKSGNTLWINYKRPEAGQAAGQPQAKYFVKALDLSVPGTPRLGAEVNIPGQLMAVVGESLYTVDHSWSGKSASATLNMLILRADLAYLQASQPLAEKSPTGLVVDDKNIIVTYYDGAASQYAMAIYEAANKQFTQKSATALPFYSVLREARQGKVLVQAGNGFLLYDIRQAQGPLAQAYFPAANWGSGVTLVGDEVYVPAGFYGIHQFNLATVNLL
jgi:hypothetical protein